MSLASSAAYVALIRCNSKSIASLKLAFEWHARDIGDMISTLSKILNITDVSTSYQHSQENFDQYDNRHNTKTFAPRLGLATFAPRLGLATLAPRLRRQNYLNDFDSENGDMG